MNCIKCGQPLAEGVKFCPYCGTRAEQVQGNVFCTTCGAKLEPSTQFCPGCGIKVGQTTGQTVDNTVATSGKLITTIKVSMYEGTPAVGLAKASGPLSVYNDRIEFKKQMGNSLGAAFGLVGIAVANSKIKNDPLDIYPVGQIAQLRVGKYGGVYNTLVVVLRGGTTISFCPAMPGSSAPQKIIDSLQPYLR